MGGRGSGGSNAIPIEVHCLRGTLRGDRHLAPTTSAPDVLSGAARRRTLAGLDREARRVAARVLDEYGDWDEASLTLVRAFARSVARIEQLEATGAEPAEIRREVRLAAGLARGDPHFDSLEFMLSPASEELPEIWRRIDRRC